VSLAPAAVSLKYPAGGVAEMSAARTPDIEAKPQLTKTVIALKVGVFMVFDLV
jgi:hypothetical protein